MQADGGGGWGGSWREWRAAQSLPEMSFCQAVPGGMTHAINLSQHLSINQSIAFSRVKSVCDMPHLTVALGSGADASLIVFGSGQDGFTRGRWPAKVPTYQRLLKGWTHEEGKKCVKFLIFVDMILEFKARMAVRVDYRRQVGWRKSI